MLPGVRSTRCWSRLYLLCWSGLGALLHVGYVRVQVASIIIRVNNFLASLVLPDRRLASGGEKASDFAELPTTPDSAYLANASDSYDDGSYEVTFSGGKESFRSSDVSASGLRDDSVSLADLHATNAAGSVPAAQAFPDISASSSSSAGDGDGSSLTADNSSPNAKNDQGNSERYGTSPTPEGVLAEEVQQGVARPEGAGVRVSETPQATTSGDGVDPPSLTSSERQDSVAFSGENSGSSPGGNEGGASPQQVVRTFPPRMLFDSEESC